MAASKPSKLIDLLVSKHHEKQIKPLELKSKQNSSSLEQQKHTIITKVHSVQETSPATTIRKVHSPKSHQFARRIDKPIKPDWPDESRLPTGLTYPNVHYELKKPQRMVVITSMLEKSSDRKCISPRLATPNSDMIGHQHPRCLSSDQFQQIEQPVSQFDTFQKRAVDTLKSFRQIGSGAGSKAFMSRNYSYLKYSMPSTAVNRSRPKTKLNSPVAEPATTTSNHAVPTLLPVGSNRYASQPRGGQHHQQSAVLQQQQQLNEINNLMKQKGLDLQVTEANNNTPMMIRNVQLKPKVDISNYKALCAMQDYASQGVCTHRASQLDEEEEEEADIEESGRAEVVRNGRVPQSEDKMQTAQECGCDEDSVDQNYFRMNQKYYEEQAVAARIENLKVRAVSKILKTQRPLLILKKQNKLEKRQRFQFCGTQQALPNKLVKQPEMKKPQPINDLRLDTVLNSPLNLNSDRQIKVSKVDINMDQIYLPQCSSAASPHRLALVQQPDRQSTRLVERSPTSNKKINKQPCWQETVQLS